MTHEKRLICANCCFYEDDPKLSKPCTDSRNGRHRMVKHQRWRAVIEMEWFDVRGPAHAKNLFAETCIDRGSIVSVEKV